MKTKHTTTPWGYSRMLLTNSTKDRRSGFVVNGPDNGEDIPIRICDLRVPCGLSGFAEGEANARLIASAPAMLDTLRKIAAYIPCDTDYYKHCGALQTAARAAIAAATGKGEA